MMLDPAWLMVLLVLALGGLLCALIAAFIVALHVIREGRRLAAAARDDLRTARRVSQAAQSRTALALQVTQTARARAESDRERLVRLAEEAAVRARGQDRGHGRKAGDG